MLICDAHTHFFSKKFFELLAGQAADAGEGAPEELLARIREKAGVEIPSASPGEHVRRWLQEFHRNGIERAVSFASHPGEASAVLDAVAVSEDRMIPYLMCDGSSSQGIEAAIQGLREGFRGVLLFPAMGHFDPASHSLDSLYEEAASRRAPIVVHCGILQIKLRDLLGVRPQYDLRHATPLSVSAAAERHPRNSFVLPHFGGGFFRETLIAGAQSPNISVDTSSSNSWIDVTPEVKSLSDVFQQTLSTYGPERIYFGTDSSTFPRGWRSDLFREQESVLEALGVGPREKNRIFGENLLEQFAG